MLGLFSFLRPQNTLIPILLVAAAAASLYVWSMNRTINSLQEELVQLETNNAQLTSAVENQQATISFLRNQARLIAQEYRDTEQAFVDARRDAENLKKQLQAVDVDKLSIESPIASESAINDTTIKLYRCFELLSGAPLNEKEIAAKDRQEFNYMCSWLHSR
jgi:predicted  nucleic acid-binding Zn-ribbon protein